MTTASDIFNRSLQQVKRHSPEILTGFGVAGVFGTSYLVGRASFKAKALIDDKAPYESTKDKAILVWRLYIPATLSGAVTIGCIIGSSRSSVHRTAAAVTAYSLTQRAFDEYRDKVVEQIGQSKEQKIRDEIAQEKVLESPPTGREILIVGKGEVLCCELYTGRYFKCDMETLRRAENEINHLVNTSAGLWVTLSDFYDILDLPHTSDSDNLGWDTEKLLELQFSAVLTPEHEPCIAFEYNYLRPQDHR